VNILSSLPKPERPDLPAIALSSIGDIPGKALTAGFGVEEIGDEADRASFMKKAFEAIGHGSQQVVLVDDDMSGAGLPNVRPAVSAAIQSATGSDPTVINVPPGEAGPGFARLRGNTVVWATGQASLSAKSDKGVATMETLRRFLSDGGKLVLTGRDALLGNEDDLFVTGTLGLKVESNVYRLPKINGFSGTSFAEESYQLNSSRADADLHDVLTPANSVVATTQGIYPASSSWGFLSGTSMATPHATGTAALAASVNPALLDDPVALKKAVMDGGKPAPLTDGKTVTGDMVDAQAALRYADTTSPEVTPGDLISDGKWYSSPQERSFQASDSGSGLNYAHSGLDTQGGFTLRVSTEPTSRDSSGNFVPVEDSYTIYDKVGNSTTRSFSALIDLTEPELDSKADITEEATSASGDVVNYDKPSGSDALSGLTEAGVNCLPASDSTFALGTTHVTCSAEDRAGNKASGSFSVIVTDTTGPQLDLPDDISIEAQGANGATIEYQAAATDVVDGPVDVICTPSSGSTFALGETTVSCTATDAAGNKAEGSFKVVVSDTTAPNLKLPNAITEEATSKDGATVSYSATANDAVDGEVAVDCTLASGSTFPLGTTTVECSAADAAGNKAMGSFDVTVRDTTAPAISGMPSDTTKTATGSFGAMAVYDSPTATDLVDGSVPVNCDPPSGYTFRLGETIVTCTATDSRGNKAEETFKVRVAYSWSEVLQPINSDGSSIFKLGRTIPVKFRLTGESEGITDAEARLYLSKVSDSVTGTKEEATSTAAATEGNLFRYDASEDQYVFNLSTEDLVQGTYRLRIDLSDGERRMVDISLK